MNINLDINALESPDGSKTYTMMAQDYDAQRFSSVTALTDPNNATAAVRSRGGSLNKFGVVRPDVWNEVKTVEDSRDEPLPCQLMDEMARGIAYVLGIEADSMTFARLFGYTEL